ncbi:MAG: glycine zipper 2TM domain-containing protein [Rhodocyclaceae bacterium]|nr:MAG: glycine zipper 2TM domain-containing protein [Rhodocyclaceae bacterium]
MNLPTHFNKGETAMNTRPKLLYPSLIAAAISVTAVSLAGVAALTGHLPSASAAADAEAQAKHAEAAKPTCALCGVVESVRLVEHRGEGSGLGAVAGGVAGAVLGNQLGNGNGRTAMTLIGAGGGAYMGNEMEKNSKRSSSYQVRVLLDNGTVRTLYQHEVPSVAAGDRVKIANGIVVPA